MAAARFSAVIKLLESGEVQAAEVQLSVLYRDAVGDGVREYGKPQSGGTLRLFLLREFESYFFVDIALKKSNKGAPEIASARARAKLIKAAGRQRSVAAYKAALGDDYRIEPIPPPANQGKKR